MYCTLQGWSINTIRFVEVHAVLVARASVKRARRANVESCYARTNQAVTMPPPILLILLLRAGRDSVQGLQGQVHCSRPLGGPSGAPARRWRDALRQQRRHWRGIGMTYSRFVPVQGRRKALQQQRRHCGGRVRAPPRRAKRKSDTLTNQRRSLCAPQHTRLM